MDGVIALLGTARHICRSEGPASLLRRWCSFVWGQIFRYQTYYLYADPVDYDSPLNEGEAKPDIDNLTARIVSSNREADELEAQGLDFRSYVRGAKTRLNRGAVAHCIFVGKELAHIGWVALNQQAMDSLDEPPYRVDFANREAVATGVWTNPKYRRKGLQKYGGFLYFSALREKGILVRRSAVRKNNITNLKARSRFSPSPYAEGRYLTFLWWKSWKEKRLTPPEQITVRESDGPTG